MKKYLLNVQELKTRPVVSALYFDLSALLSHAKIGDYSLLNMLFSASKVKIREYYDFGEKQLFKEYVFCTPKKGRNISKERVKKILPTHIELVQSLVNFHNLNCREIGRDAVSFDELRGLYVASHQKYSL